jgi:hypothetical protein
MITVYHNRDFMQYSLRNFTENGAKVWKDASVLSEIRLSTKIE